MEVQKLNSTTATSIITALKAVFSAMAFHAVTTAAKNGPWFASVEMIQFSTTYGFIHVTSSPTTIKPMDWSKEYRDI